MSSILTNNGAMVALQTLKGINAGLSQTQNEISTGKAINSAKDNAAIWSISKVMETDVNSFKAVSNSLSLGSGATNNARQAAESVAELVDQIKSKVIAAQNGNFDRTTLQNDVNDLKKQITSVVGASQFNGVNLINGDTFGGATTFKMLSSIDRAQAGTITAATIDVDLTDTNLSMTGKLTALAAIDLTTSTDFAADLTTVETALKAVTGAATIFGAAGKRVETQSNFISKLSDSMTSAMGTMVDANMEEASARLQALQTQQQLGIQSLSIANQAPKTLLSLFRG